MAAKATGKSSKKSVTVEMTVDRDTKNTRRYQADNEDAPISTLYISKSASTPDEIVVTVSF
jgi:hypothetical protein